MNRKLLLFVLLLMVIAQRHSFGQEANADEEFNPIVDDITKRIPNLEALVDSAVANSPYLKFRDAEIEVANYKYLNERSQLLRNIGFSVETRYGMLNNYSENYSGIVSVPVGGTLSNQFQYGAGAYIKIPLYDLTNRKNTNKLAKKEIEQAINHRNELIHEIKRDVIVQYNDLILRQKLLKISSDNMLTSEMQLKMAEKQFMSGSLPLGEMSRMMDINARARMEFEQQKTAFITAYQLLEVTVGLKFNLLNRID
jgi:outer membrane protein TolC